MKKIIYPITVVNFEEAWNYTNNKLLEIKKKRVIRDFLKVFANIAFFFSLTLLTYGVLMNFGSESIIKFLDSFTLLKNMWNMTMLNQANLHIGLKFVIYLGILIVPSLIVSGITTLIVWFSYKPNKKEMTGNNEEDSKILYEMAKELSLRADSQKEIFSVVLIIAYIFELLYTGVLFGFFLLKENNIALHETMLKMALSYIDSRPNLKIYLIESIRNYTIICLLIIFVIFVVLYLISDLFLKVFYKTKIDTNLKSASEDFYYTSNPSARENKDKEEAILEEARKLKSKKQKELTTEELEIKKEAIKITENRNAEKKALSKIVNYEKPIYKGIKIATSILPIVIICICVISFLNTSSIDLYNNYGVVYIKNDISDSEYEELKTMNISSSENVGLISSIEELQKLTPEQRELLVKAWQVDKNNPEEVEAFLKESGLYDYMYQEDTSDIPTLEEAMKEQEEKIKEQEHLQDGIWGN